MAVTFNDEQEAELLKLLGLPEAAPGDTDAGLTLDTITDLAHQVEGLDPAKPSTIAASARRHGMDLVDHETHESLKRDATAGRQIAAAAAKAKVEASVDAAVDKGKITPSSRKHWVTLIEVDPGMADVLAAVPDETAVPMSEVGHATDTGTGGVTDAAAWFY